MHLFLIFVATILSVFANGQTLTCYCQDACPDKDLANGTCTVRGNGYCYSAIESLYNPKANRNVGFRTFGCVYGSTRWSRLSQCGAFINSKIQKNITCCQGDFCNVDLLPSLNYTSRPDVLPKRPGLLPKRPDFLPKRPTASPILFTRDHEIAISAFASVSLCLILCALLYAYTRWRKCKENKKSMIANTSDMNRNIDIEKELSISSSKVEFHGNFGEFYMKNWKRKEDEHTGKLNEKMESEAFEFLEREKQIYKSRTMSHPNIFGRIELNEYAKEGIRTRMLMTGQESITLREYLQSKCLDQDELWRMAIGIISGLEFLHNEIYGANRKMPAIIHRDLNSKNILVKWDSTCCIANFGSAALCEGDVKPLHIRERTEIRYLPPEVLSKQDTNITGYFILQKADIYSYGLILWEICSRTKFDKDGPQPASYELPFAEEVPLHPSIMDMYKVVCIKRKRPTFHISWTANQTLDILKVVMKESWYSNPAARPTPCRIKKNLQTTSLTTQKL